MAQQDDFDVSAAFNTEDPSEGLGDLDFGDTLEEIDDAAVADDTAPEPAEPEVDSEPAAEPDAPAPDGEPAAADDVAAEGDADAADDPDAVADPEAEAETDPEAEPQPRNDKGQFIPKSRFDQRTAQLRAAEREMETLRQQLKEQETARQKAEREAATLSDEQLEAKMSEANAALVEGDTEKAAKLQREVFAAMRTSQAAPEAPAVDEATITARVMDQMTFKQTLEKIQTAYPQLNENSDAYDEALSVEAVGFQKMYFEQGYTRAEATEKAALAVAKLHDLSDASAPAPAPAKAPAKATAAQKAQAAATQAKVKAAQSAPPAVGGTRDTADTPEVDLDNMDADEWAALPASVRARLLGI